MPLLHNEIFIFKLGVKKCSGKDKRLRYGMFMLVAPCDFRKGERGGIKW